jgi:membrane fusion protein (multidrug efflux system)
MNALIEKPAAAPVTTVSAAAPTAPRPGRMRRRLLLVAGVAAIGGALVVGNWWLAEGRFLESTDNAYVQGDIAVLGPRIEGDVIAIPVADNQPVRAGDPLILLDPADSRARLDQARGQLAEARASVTTARSQIGQNQTAIDQADAMIAEARAEQTRAVAEAGRSGALTSAGWTSRAANDTAVADRRKADAAMAAAMAQRAGAEAALAVARAQLGSAEAHVLTAAAALRLAENNLADTVIRAPFDGVVGNRAAQLGQHVVTALQLIAVAPERGRLYVVANFKETQLAAMRPGQRARLVPDIDSAAAVDGVVDSLAPATGALFSLLPPENATGNFTKVVQRVPVKIVIDPAQAARASWLRAGLSVTAEVDTRGPEAVRRGLWGQLAARLGL